MGLNCMPSSSSCVFPTINEFLGQVSMIDNVSDKLRNLDDYIKRLEAEMRKIDGFKRDLPLCIFLLNHAIGVLKKETVQCRKLNGEPVLEEFIPLKKTCDGEEDEEEDNHNHNVEIEEQSEDIQEKMNWLSSAQLGSCTGELSSVNLHINSSKHNVKSTILKRNYGEVSLLKSDDHIKSRKSHFLGHAYEPFKRYTSFPLIAARNEEEKLPGVPGLSLQTAGMTNLGDGILASHLSSKTGPYRSGSTSTSSGQCSSHSRLQSQQQQQQQQANRKQRRCWSAELHRRFVDALQQLGGTQVATPKQIRELMQVDGLTNDEVKSHLQKYRLHSKRNSVTSASTPNESGTSRHLRPGLENIGEPLKKSNSESGSPEGPLQYGGTSGGTSVTGGDIMEHEVEEKSESYSWKGHAQSLEKNSV